MQEAIIFFKNLNQDKKLFFSKPENYGFIQLVKKNKILLYTLLNLGEEALNKLRDKDIITALMKDIPYQQVLAMTPQEYERLKHKEVLKLIHKIPLNELLVLKDVELLKLTHPHIIKLLGDISYRDILAMNPIAYKKLQYKGLLKTLHEKKLITWDTHYCTYDQLVRVYNNPSLCYAIKKRDLNLWDASNLQEETWKYLQNKLIEHAILNDKIEINRALQITKDQFFILEMEHAQRIVGSEKLEWKTFLDLTEERLLQLSWVLSSSLAVSAILADIITLDQAMSIPIEKLKYINSSIINTLLFNRDINFDQLMSISAKALKRLRNPKIITSFNVGAFTFKDIKFLDDDDIYDRLKNPLVCDILKNAKKSNNEEVTVVDIFNLTNAEYSTLKENFVKKALCEHKIAFEDISLKLLEIIRIIYEGEDRFIDMEIDESVGDDDSTVSVEGMQIDNGGNDDSLEETSFNEEMTLKLN